MNPWPPAEPGERWQLRIVGVPCGVGAVLAFLLGTAGYFFAGFGMETACTDFTEDPHACDALSRWLEADVIGQGVLILVAAGLLITGRILPQSRLLLSIAAWIAAGTTIAWYCLCIFGANRSWRPGQA